MDIQGVGEKGSIGQKPQLSIRELRLEGRGMSELRVLARSCPRAPPTVSLSGSSKLDGGRDDQGYSTISTTLVNVRDNSQKGTSTRYTAKLPAD